MVNKIDFFGFGFGLLFGIDHVLDVIDYSIWEVCVNAWWLSIVGYLCWLIYMHWKNRKPKIVFGVLSVIIAMDLGKIAGIEMGLNVEGYPLYYQKIIKGEGLSADNLFVYGSFLFIICKAFDKFLSIDNSQTLANHRGKLDQERQPMTKYQKRNQKRRNQQNDRRALEENEEQISIVLENGNNFVPERESQNIIQPRNRNRRRRNQNRRLLEEAENNLKPNILVEDQNINNVLPQYLNQNVEELIHYSNLEENLQLKENLNLRQKEENTLEKILECPICLEEFKNPKMLPCQHSFCMEDCLKSLVESNSVSKEIICPICRKKCSVPRKGFPNNYTLQSLLELTSEEPKVV